METTDQDGSQDATHPVTATTLTVMTYNILAGGGKRLQHISEIVRETGAHVVALQEVLRPDWVDQMAHALGMYHVIGKAPDGWHLALLSQYPIVEAQTHTAPQMRRGLLEAQVEAPGGTPLRLFVTHLHAGYSQFRAGERRRLREVRFVLERMRGARLRGEPHLLLGDLNSLAPGERLRASLVLRHALETEQRERAMGRRLEGHPNLDNILPAPLRPVRSLLVAAFGVPPVAWLCDELVNLYVPRAVVRSLTRAGYIDTYAATHPDRRTRGYTCPLPSPAGRIDYIFADPLARKGLLSSEIVMDGPGRDVAHASDHRPLVATLRLGACSAS